MVQGAAFMRHLKADADFLCILPENLLIGYDNKSGGVTTGLIHSFFQNFQSINL